MANKNGLAECSAWVIQIRMLLQEKQSRLQELQTLKRWKVGNGTFDPDIATNEQEEWSEATISYSWDTHENGKTFYHRLALPEHFMGIHLCGSRVWLEFACIVGSSLFINGKNVYRADYWADTQVIPIELASKLDRESDYKFVLHTRQGDGLGFFHKADVKISAVEEWIFQLDTFSEELDFTLFLLQQGEIGEETGVGVLLNALSLFDEQAMHRNEWDAVAEMLRRIRQELLPFTAAAKTYKVRLVGHAHIDMNWLWPQAETEDLIRRDFEVVDALMEEYPEFCFSHSQAATYKIIEENCPELWQRVKKRLAQDRWEVTASTWVEGDLNMSGYETLIRQFLQGKTYVREKFGQDPIICWEPDTFGHPATMPQILCKSGIRYYYQTRPRSEVPLYWWEGANGSRVLVFNDPCSYNGRIYASQIMTICKRLAMDYGLRTGMYVFGIGDHGGGATRDDVQRAIRLNESPLLPRFIFSKAVDFYREAERSVQSLPVIRGELNPVFEGCYTSHADIKKANRETEHALIQAETLSAIAEIYRACTGDHKPPSPGVDVNGMLREPWRLQCFNQFHDILCGCSIHETYDKALNGAAQARNKADVLSEAAMRSVQSHVSNNTAAAWGNDNRIMEVTVFNTLSWVRTDVVEIISEDPGIETWKTGDLMIDAQGERSVLQRSGDNCYFTAFRIPAMGFKTYRHVSVDAPSPPQQVAVSDMNHYVLENDKLSLAIDPKSGTVLSLIIRGTNKQLSHTPPSGFIESSHTKGLLNLLEMQQEAPHGMSAWKFGTITGTYRFIDGAEATAGVAGPVFQSVNVVHRYSNTVISQDIRLYRELERIDFVTSVDWGEQGSGKTDAPMLRVYFTPKLASTVPAFNIPFGTISRVADGREVSALQWIDVSEEDARYGLTLMNNAKYGHAIQGNTLSLTLLRSSYEPDNRPDVGHHAFTYSIYPHMGNWREAQSDRRAWELNQPLRASVAMQNRKDTQPTTASFGLLEIQEKTAAGWKNAKGIVATAFKPAEQSRTGRSEWILRMTETHGATTSVRIVLHFPGKVTEEVNFLEDKLLSIQSDDAGYEFNLGDFRPGDILSYRIGI